MATLKELIDYSRQTDMDRQFNSRVPNFYNKFHIIVGCGGIGFWLGVILAMLGCRHFFLIEGDAVDKSNLNRIPLPFFMVGKNKALALRKFIRLLRPDSAIMVHTKHLDSNNVGIVSHLINDDSYSVQKYIVWDTTDNARTQNMLYNAIKSLQPNFNRYIKIGYEGFSCGVYKVYNTWISDDYQPGYRTSKANVLSSIMAASFGIMKFIFGHAEEDLNIDLIKTVNPSTKSNTIEEEVYES